MTLDQYLRRLFPAFYIAVEGDDWGSPETVVIMPNNGRPWIRLRYSLSRKEAALEVLRTAYPQVVIHV